MNAVDAIIEPYIELECAVRELMASQFSQTCGMCTACCCRADICEEVPHSAFLSRLLELQGRSEGDMDDRYGWLDLQGCSLGYGRPPVCYRYFCDALLARLPDDETRYVTKILGRLVEYVGENAVGHCHLAEIANPEDLAKVEPHMILERLAQAQEAYRIIEQFIDSGTLTPAECSVLEGIGLADD